MSAALEGATTKVLIIDSNVFFAHRLSEALNRVGIEAIHSTRPDYALTMLEWDAPSAILCAAKLGEMGAYELSQIVHGDAKTANLPIIVIGSSGDHALMNAFRAGCADFVDRRLGPQNIAAHVRTFLRSQDEGFRPTQMLETSETALEGNLSHLDLPGVIQMLQQARKSGALHVNGATVDGIIFLAEGEISHAECGDRVGDDAVIHIFKSCSGDSSGVYKFVPGNVGPLRTVLRTATALMLEAACELDEALAAGEGGRP
jgi:DNA-binding response OmpR family regulator